MFADHDAWATETHHDVVSLAAPVLDEEGVALCALDDNGVSVACSDG